MADAHTVDMANDVIDGVEEHCFSRVDVEVGGFLFGSVTGDGVRVEAFHPALQAESGQAHLTFTHEAWSEALATLDAQHSTLAIVGWYHTHPGFGCFLSAYDTFIQENFFSADGQHALVIDPLAGRWARFRMDGEEVLEVAAGDTRRAALGPAAKEEQLQQAAGPARRRRAAPIVFAIVLVALVAAGVGWLVGSLQGREAGRSAAESRVEAAESAANDLQRQLDEVLASVAAAEPTVPVAPEAAPTTPTPTPTAVSPSPEPSVTAPPSPSPEPSTEASAAEPEFVVYVVRPGDTMWDIAERLLGDGTRFAEIIRDDPAAPPESLRVGETVRVPVPGGGE